MQSSFCCSLSGVRALADPPRARPHADFARAQRLRRRPLTARAARQNLAAGGDLRAGNDGKEPAITHPARFAPPTNHQHACSHTAPTAVVSRFEPRFMHVESPIRIQNHPQLNFEFTRSSPACWATTTWSRTRPTRSRRSARCAPAAGPAAPAPRPCLSAPRLS